MQTQQATTQMLAEIHYQMNHGNWTTAAHLAAQAIRSAVLQEPDLLPVAQEELARIWRARGRGNSAAFLFQRASRSYGALGLAADSRRCLLTVAEILLDAGRAQEAQRAVNALGGGLDTLVLRGRLYALQGDRYRLQGVAGEVRHKQEPLGPDDYLVLALHEMARGRTNRATERLQQAMHLAATVWDVYAMQRIERAQEGIQRGGKSA